MQNEPPDDDTPQFSEHDYCCASNEPAALDLSLNDDDNIKTPKIK